MKIFPGPIILVLFTVSFSAGAQKLPAAKRRGVLTESATARTTQDEKTPMPQPSNPADVASLDNIVRALYDSISGPAGQRRDGRRFRSLFHPGARLIPTAPRTGGGAKANVYTVEEFFELVAENTKTSGFFEKEIARRTDVFGNVAHVFSTYEARRSLDDAEPFARGINSIQLLKDGARWWVITIFWDTERPDNPLPKEYLPARRKAAGKRTR